MTQSSAPRLTAWPREQLFPMEPRTWPLGKQVEAVMGKAYFVMQAGVTVIALEDVC